MTWDVVEGDCVEVMQGMEAESVDAVVCDPPYLLTFMGRSWDHAPSPYEGQKQHQRWATEALRVLKPGGWLIAAGGTRTFHRLACALEDAGFEIRDCIAHMYGSGFPKSLNVSEALRRLPACLCDVSDQLGAVDANLPTGAVGAGTGTEAGTVSLAGTATDEAGRVRPNIGTDAAGAFADMDGRVKEGVGDNSPIMLGASGMAGAAEGDEIRSGVGGVEIAPETLRDDVVDNESGGGSTVGAGSIAGDDLGGNGRPSTAPVLPLAASPNGISGSDEATTVGDGHAVSGAIDGDALSVAGADPSALDASELHALKCKACGGVRRELLPEGFGTALKPAFEPWTLARKPLAGTVAQNVLEHGTGALNVDGCRIGTDEDTARARALVRDTAAPFGRGAEMGGNGSSLGRWPSNTVLSHTEDCTNDLCEISCPVRLLDEQSGELHSQDPVTRGNIRTGNFFGGENTSVQNPGGYGDSGGASRFFFTAQTSDADGMMLPCDASSAESSSSPSSQAAVSVPSDVPTSDNPEATPLSGSKAPSTNATPSGSKLRSESDMQPIPSSDGKSSPGSQHVRPIPTPNPASDAAATEPTDTTTTTPMPLKSGGSAEAAMSTDTPPNLALGGAALPVDSGAERFRYTAKASRAERNAGLEGFEEREAPDFDGRPSGDFAKRMNRERPPVMKQNIHPTVKPIALMRWLCRLVTPPGGKILDPFLGSGTTGIAAGLEGFDFVGIEREAEYAEIARARLSFWAEHGEEALEQVRRLERAETEREEIRDAGQGSLFG